MAYRLLPLLSHILEMESYLLDNQLLWRLLWIRNAKPYATPRSGMHSPSAVISCTICALYLSSTVGSEKLSPPSSASFQRRLWLSAANESGTVRSKQAGQSHVNRYADSRYWIRWLGFRKG
jgi:hypothetical protein